MGLQQDFVRELTGALDPKIWTSDQWFMALPFMFACIFFVFGMAFRFLSTDGAINIFEMMYYMCMIICAPVYVSFFVSEVKSGNKKKIY